MCISCVTDLHVAPLHLPKPPPWYTYWWMVEDWELSQDQPSLEASGSSSDTDLWSSLVDELVDSHDPSKIASVLSALSPLVLREEPRISSSGVHALETLEVTLNSIKPLGGPAILC